MKSLREIALRYPEVEEGTSCGKRAFRARDKAFLFVGVDAGSWNAMFKLGASLPEAARLAKKKPGRYAVGGHGWVKATFGADDSPPAGLLERWIDESFRLLAPKPLVAMLEPGGSKRTGKAKTGKTRRAK